MASPVDLTGQRFGRLTVRVDSGRRGVGGQILWDCRCACGRRRLVLGANLRTGNTRSCGCLRRLPRAERLAVR